MVSQPESTIFGPWTTRSADLFICENMGLLSNLFGQQNIQLEGSIVPQQALDMIYSGKLPIFDTNTILLDKNEKCHFIDKVILLTEEKVRNYMGGNASINYRLTKRLSTRLGGMRLGPTTIKKPKYVKGIIYVTSKRIIFTGADESFEKNISTLTSIVPQEGMMGLQFNTKIINIIMNNPSVLGELIQLVKKNDD